MFYMKIISFLITIRYNNKVFDMKYMNCNTVIRVNKKNKSKKNRKYFVNILL